MGVTHPKKQINNKTNTKIMNTQTLKRFKNTVPFSERLNDFIKEWFDKHEHLFKFVDKDDFDETDIAGTFERHKEFFKTEGYIKIWKGASDNTIFGEPKMNWMFRAWHDYIHITYNHGYDFVGESIACQIQKEMLPMDWTFEKELIHAEIIGQAQFFLHNDYFIEDQRLFTAVYLNDGVTKALTLTNK